VLKTTYLAMKLRVGTIRPRLTNYTRNICARFTRDIKQTLIQFTLIQTLVLYWT